MHKLLFAGPSCDGADLELLAGAGFELRPPAKRGSVRAELAGAPGVIVIVDGWCNRSLSVSHCELHAALPQGCAVWGIGAIGALRAVEMRALGMRGFGRAFALLENDPATPDDEFLCLHSLEQPYPRRSEPLIDLRGAFSLLAA